MALTDTGSSIVFVWNAIALQLVNALIMTIRHVSAPHLLKMYFPLTVGVASANKKIRIARNCGKENAKTLGSCWINV
jgi:hypothetical protein